MSDEPWPSFSTDASSSSRFALRCNRGALITIQKDCGVKYDTVVDSLNNLNNLAGRAVTFVTHNLNSTSSNLKSQRA